MSAAGKGIFNQPFWPFLFEVIAIDPPYLSGQENPLKQLEEAAAQDRLAGFIFEPLIQGVAGMRTHSLQGLDNLIAFCRQNGILTIADEVMTGLAAPRPYLSVSF